MNFSTQVKTKRLFLRPLGEEDFDDVWEMVTDEDIVRMLMGWPWPADEAYTRQRLIAPAAQNGWISAVTLKGETIGMAGATNGSIWYFLKRAFWGQGFAQEVLAAKIFQAFEEPERDKLVAGTWFDNPASMHILEKAGFVRTGWDKAYCHGRNAEVEGPEYELTRERWEACH